MNPEKKYRVCMMSFSVSDGRGSSQRSPTIPSGKPYFSAPIAHGQQYASMILGRRAMAMDSGASKRLF